MWRSSRRTNILFSSSRRLHVFKEQSQSMRASRCFPRSPWSMLWTVTYFGPSENERQDGRRTSLRMALHSSNTDFLAIRSNALTPLLLDPTRRVRKLHEQPASRPRCLGEKIVNLAFLDMPGSTSTRKNSTCFSVGAHLASPNFIRSCSGRGLGFAAVPRAGSGGRHNRTISATIELRLLSTGCRHTTEDSLRWTQPRRNSAGCWTSKRWKEVTSWEFTERNGRTKLVVRMRSGTMVVWRNGQTHCTNWPRRRQARVTSVETQISGRGVDTKMDHPFGLQRRSCPRPLFAGLPWWRGFVLLGPSTIYVIGLQVLLSLQVRATLLTLVCHCVRHTKRSTIAHPCHWPLCLWVCSRASRAPRQRVPKPRTQPRCPSTLVHPGARLAPSDARAPAVLDPAQDGNHTAWSLSFWDAFAIFQDHKHNSTENEAHRGFHESDTGRHITMQWDTNVVLMTIDLPMWCG